MLLLEALWVILVLGATALIACLLLVVPILAIASFGRGSGVRRPKTNPGEVAS